MSIVKCDSCGGDFVANLDMDLYENICPDCWDEGPLPDADDGQPSEYEEWQDVYGGDVEEYGTYGEYDYGDW